METVSIKDFLVLVNQLNTAYSGRYALKGESEIKIFYEALNDLELSILRNAVLECVRREQYFPSIATIRKYATNKQYPDWSVEWNRYTSKVPLYELSKPTQYVVKLLTQRYINGMVGEGHIGQIQKEFRQLYEKYCNEDMETKLIEAGESEKFIYINPNLQIEEEKEEPLPPGAIRLPNGSIDYTGGLFADMEDTDNNYVDNN